MQTFFVAVYDLYTNRDEIDVCDDDIRVVYIMDCKPGEMRLGGYAVEEQE